MNEQSHETMIPLITEARFSEIPQYIDRIAIGVCNELCRVGLKEREVIVRLSPHDRFLMGSHNRIQKFKTFVKDHLPNLIKKRLLVSCKVIL